MKVKSKKKAQKLKEEEYCEESKSPYNKEFNLKTYWVVRLGSLSHQEDLVPVSVLCIDCEQSLFFFRFSKGSARARGSPRRKIDFSFHAKKSLDRERPFSLALRVVSLFSCLSHLAPSVTRVAICVCSTDYRKKRDCAQSIVCEDLVVSKAFQKVLGWNGISLT